MSATRSSRRSPGCVRRAPRPRAPDRGRARRSSRAIASRSCSTTGSRPRSCTGPHSGPAPSSSRSRGGWRTRSSTTASTTAVRVSSCEKATTPGRAGAPGRARPAPGEISLILYTSGTTGRPKGVPRSHSADRAGGWSQALQHGYAWADRTLGVMPLYHTMGIHSLLAMHLVGGCFVPQARWDAGEALRLIEEQRITSLYLAPTLFHDLVHHPDARTRDVSSVRALGYAGAAMTSTLVRRCADVFAPRGVRQPLRLDRGLHVHDRPRPAREARMRRPPCGEHAAAPRSSQGEIVRRPLPPTRRSPGTGTAPTPTRRRSGTAGTRPATRATSTTTATSGSTAGSTT